MKVQPKKTERIHAMDSLRAIMMLLGILFHAGITYVGGEPSSSWPIRDPEGSNLFFKLLVSYLHVFRMPVFMVVAGFFAALLFYERSPRKMVINRKNRILYPFIAASLILWPICTLICSYTNKMFGWTKTVKTDEGRKFLDTSFDTFTNIASFIPEKTMHLWFLYYLIMFCAISFLMGLLFKKLPSFTSKVTLVFNKILDHSGLKILVFTLLTFILLQFINNKTNFSYVPDINTFGYYFYFYMFGWVLFKSKSLLSTFKNFDWQFLLSGTLLYIGSLMVMGLKIIVISPQIKILINSASVWLLVFGITGLFIRYASNHSSRMRYISDASYWVYLLHLPFTLLFPGLFADLPIPSIAKFLISVSLTTMICFITYHYFVRGTFIGKFLNGRKYSKRLSDIKQETSVGKLKPALDK